MGNYNRGGFNGRSSGGFRGRSGGFDRDRRPAEMHDAVCDKCKKECQVPFRPTGDKPVLCRDCFKQGGGSSRGRSFSGSSSGISSEQFNQLNVKLDKIIEILQGLEMDIDDDTEDGQEDSEDDSEMNSKKH